MTVRISGIVIPNEKRLVISLTYLYGIGLTLSQKILADLKIDESIRTKDVTEDQAQKIRDYIKNHNIRIENDLKREVMGNIKRMKEIRSYRGIRHEKNLPVRGQRTKTNQRTRKGNKRTTLGSGRAKVTKT